MEVNKTLVWESLKNCIDNRNGVLPVETFKTLLAEGMDAPITEDDWPKLLKIYDKKNEGVLNWEDLITDHKYIHAVSIYTCSSRVYSCIIEQALWDAPNCIVHLLYMY